MLWFMKRIALFLCISGALGFGEEVTLTKSAIIKAERSIVSLKAGTVVELLSRDAKLLTVRYGKVTGTIPAGSIEGVAAVGPAKKEEAAAPVPPPPPAGAKKATTTYGKAVEKAKENAGKHDKNLARPTDEILK